MSYAIYFLTAFALIGAAGIAVWVGQLFALQKGEPMKELFYIVRARSLYLKRDDPSIYWTGVAWSADLKDACLYENGANAAAKADDLALSTAIVPRSISLDVKELAIIRKAR